MDFQLVFSNCSLVEHKIFLSTKTSGICRIYLCIAHTKWLFLETDMGLIELIITLQIENICSSYNRLKFLIIIRCLQ